MKRLVTFTTFLVLASTALADWPQFRGPGHDNVSREKVELADSWPADGPKVLWSTPTGLGYGGAAIVGDELFILDREDDQRDVLRCLSMTDGKEKWRFQYDAPARLSHNGSRSMPAVDQKNVYIIGPLGHMHAVSRQTHEPIWRINILEQFNADRPRWGVATSPVLVDGRLIVAVGGKRAGVVELDKATGKTIWQSEPFGRMEYMSAKPVTIDGVKQILAHGNEGRTTKLIAVNPEDGKLLWSFDGWGCRIPIASPEHAGDGKVMLTGGYKAGSVMIQATKNGNDWSARELWRLNGREAGSQIQDPLVHDGHLYLDNNENGKNEGMVCLDPDGEIKWSSKDPNFNRGGQIIADGKMYKVDGRNGTLYLVDPSPEGLKVLASAKLLDRGEIWAPLSISDGKLIIRDHSKIMCIDVK